MLNLRVRKRSREPVQLRPARSRWREARQSITDG
jgi:hypothetical protein